MFKRFFIITFLAGVAGCSHQKRVMVFSNKDISNVIDHMTDIMVHDITNPPLASRFFSYACLAGYEVVSENNKDYKSMHGILNKYPDIKKNDSIKGYSTQLSALLAMMETAGKMQPSGNLLLEYEVQFLDSLKRNGYDIEVIQNSKNYALTISKQILAYAKADKYNKLSNYPRYSPLEKDGCWFPTPPAYMPALEPYFNRVRSFTLDSCSQFKPAPPVAFSSNKNSSFYKLMLLNYKDTLSEAHKAIASFWDCNPFAVQDDGHLLMGLKKISPGAHWLGITGTACEESNKSFEETMDIYTIVSIGMMDAFICCWDEKYRSNRIRPETAIRKYIDPEWKPLLQTPPFPEYLSGHSTVSSACATILTCFFGDDFHYTDSVEVAYGLPSRSYNSFQQAAIEAGVSRFYGGIHFMDAIDNGRVQGLRVGAWVWQKIKGRSQ